MKINTFDISQFIQINSLPEIKSPILLNPDMSPNSEGLLSYEVLGLPGSPKRREQFAYIELGGTFIHPIAYNIITTLDRKFIGCINGTQTFKISANGELYEDPDGETGLDFVIDNWSKFKFKKNESTIRNAKVDTIGAMKLNEIFVKQWLVIPPFYRDIDVSKLKDGRISSDEVNDYYTKLISFSKALANTTFAFTLNLSKFKIQNTLNELHSFLTQKLAKKEGLFHKALLGKTTDNSARLVISATTPSSANSPDDEMIKYGEIGVPLHVVLGLFMPFFYHNFKVFIADNFSQEKLVMIAPSENEQSEEIDLDSFSQKQVKKLLSAYIKSKTLRLKPVMVKTKNGEKALFLKTFEEMLGRDFLLIDLFYLLANFILTSPQKYIVAKRYPLETYRGMLFAKPIIVTTIKTIPVDFGHYHFKHYPLVTEKMIKDADHADKTFIDTVQVNNLYLESLGADFDGDMMGLNGLFTSEANKEAEEVINGFRGVFDAKGANMMHIGKEAVLSLYRFTR